MYVYILSNFETYVLNLTLLLVQLSEAVSESEKNAK